MIDRQDFDAIAQPVDSDIGGVANNQFARAVNTALPSDAREKAQARYDFTDPTYGVFGGFWIVEGDVGGDIVKANFPASADLIAAFTLASCHALTSASGFLVTGLVASSMVSGFLIMSVMG
jgi:hypothetical protein